MYGIEIFGTDYFTGKQCKLSVYKDIELKNNQIVDVVLCKNEIFNLKKEEK